MNKKKTFVPLAITENIGISSDTITYEDAEKFFLQKMRVAEETIVQGECMTSAQAHKFLGV